MKKRIKYYSRRLKAHRRKFRRMKRHPLMLPMVTFLVLLVVSTVSVVVVNGETGSLPNDHIVRLHVGKLTTSIPTRARTVGSFLRRAKIQVGTHDVVEPSLNTPILEDNFQINIYRAHPVTIVDGAHTTVTTTAQQEPRQVVTSAGITLYPEDIVTVADPDQAFNHNVLGEDIIIKRATPATINLYGTPVSIRTQAKTVAAVLKEKNIKPQPEDVVTPALNSPVTQHMEIIITRKGTRIITNNKVIPMPVQYVDDPTLAMGATAIRQNGSNGKEVITYQVNLENGKPVSQKVIQDVIAQPAVPEIVVRGTKILVAADKVALMAQAGIPSSDYQYVDYIVRHESGWCATKWQGEWGNCPAYHGTPTGSLTGYGLCQATPADKMAVMGGDWATNPVTQLRWCNNYAVTRYGDWYEAYVFWANHHYW